VLNSINKKHTLLIISLVFLTYCPILFNGFVGDDHVLIETNTFYGSWHNITRLFKSDYITRQKDLFINPSHDFGSGSVSYRPVLSLTYFLDYHLWGNKPYGFHLTNILIHCINCLLVFQILSVIFGSSALACFAALLFGLHPIQSEAVAVIAYRADILSTFFVLGSFYFWLKFQCGDRLKMGYYAGCLAMYFLALFSKESSVGLPVVFFLYDRFLGPSDRPLKRMAPYYAGFLFLLVFYLWVYFCIFPNSTLQRHWLGGNFVNHCLISVDIGYSYLMGFLFPWKVDLIPGTYFPSVFPLLSLKTFKIAVLFILFSVVFLRLWKYHKPIAFFLSWSLVFYLPVSNLVPLANPMAMRFMYLPSVGILAALAFFLDKAFNSPLIKGYPQKMSSIFRASVLILCIILTLLLNNNWKNDLRVALAWMQNYPSAPRSYLILAHEYDKKNMFSMAIAYYEKAFYYGDREPQEIFSMGLCYMRLGDKEKAKRCFQMAQNQLHN